MPANSAHSIFPHSKPPDPEQLGACLCLQIAVPFLSVHAPWQLDAPLERPY